MPSGIKTKEIPGVAIPNSTSDHMQPVNFLCVRFHNSEEGFIYMFFAEYKVTL